jgi:mono/diheme cytochrome c family protein
MEVHMKRYLKWLAIGVGALLGLLVIVGGILHVVGNGRLATAPEVATSPVTVPSGADAVARGEHLVQVVSECVGCHGDNLAGTVFMDEAPIGYVAAPNLTAGGIGATYADADWERAIRHGVGGDGRALVIMPSHWYKNLSDEDLGAMIAYLKQLPAVDNDLKARDITFPGTVIFGVLTADTLPVNMIDHDNVGLVKPPEEPTLAYGEYLVNIAACGECHSANYAGNTDPNGPPLGPNLTPQSELGGWDEADFVTLMRTGTKPSGITISEEMPWIKYANMSDDELSAIWLYLQSLEPLPNNE